MSRLDKVKAFVGRNRVPLGVAGAAAVVGVAVLRSRGGGPSSASKATTLPTSGTPQNQLAGASGRAYDSTESDLYNSLEPQIYSLRELMEKLQGISGSPTPTPAPPPATSTATELGVGQAVWRASGATGEWAIQGAPDNSGIKSRMLVTTSDGRTGTVYTNESAANVDPYQAQKQFAQNVKKSR